MQPLPLSFQSCLLFLACASDGSNGRVFASPARLHAHLVYCHVCVPVPFSRRFLVLCPLRCHAASSSSSWARPEDLGELLSSSPTRPATGKASWARLSLVQHGPVLRLLTGSHFGFLVLPALVALVTSSWCLCAIHMASYACGGRAHGPHPGQLHALPDLCAVAAWPDVV